MISFIINSGGAFCHIFILRDNRECAKIEQMGVFMNMKKLIVLASLGFLIGCNSATKFREEMSSWIGADKSALIQSWGVPSSNYKDKDGFEYIAYNRSRMTTIPGVAPTYYSNVIGNTIYTNPVGGAPARTVALSCNVTFTIIRDKVARYTYNGNDCYSY